MTSSGICYAYASKRRARLSPEPDDPPWVTEWLIAANGDRYVGVSSAALAWNRSVETVKKWEYRGVIPRTPFDWRGRRAYTVEQVERVAEILDSHGALTWPITRAVRVDRIHQQVVELHQELVDQHHCGWRCGAATNKVTPSATG